jgi:hypothetical protein
MPSKSKTKKTKKKKAATKKEEIVADVAIADEAEETIDAADPRVEQVEIEKVTDEVADVAVADTANAIVDDGFDDSPETPEVNKKILGKTDEVLADDAEQIADAVADEPVEEQVTDAIEAEAPEGEAEGKQPRARSYTHLNRRPDSLETVEIKKKSYLIPATMGSNYWAILRIMYHNINEPVLFDELIDGVDETMKDHDAKAWDYFCNKQQTTVWKRGEQKREVKPIKSWQDRIINNAKTLCRWKDYGKRLHERGHVMRLEHDPKNGDPYFVLYDNLDSLDGAKKKVVTKKKS